ncbi:MAG TPA: MotA/TolQ/ExbB proton channel family protein [Deltaproteobacteria bacterium]|nr:MotA/TolQ/ExbB proton channel family protein [Deltaproteobacteria bacterium]
MWPLLACSVVVVAVVIERAVFWVRLRLGGRCALREEVVALAGRGLWEAVEKKTAGSGDYVLAVLGAGARHRHGGMTAAMEAEARRAEREMGRYMKALDTMITAAPLIGIFGTVTGIITAFSTLGHGDAADPRLVGGGIAEALITTAAGLAVSIAAVFPYNYFRGLVDEAVHHMEDYGSRLEAAWSVGGDGAKAEEKSFTARRAGSRP